MDFVWIRLFIAVIFGIICSAIASSKGRSTVGWFFCGFFFSLIGLIIILCLSNLKEEESRRNAIDQENRRLREQIRQEQIKSEAFRSHAQRRLDSHDQTLGLDTRTDEQFLEGSAPVAGFLGQGAGQPADLSPGVRNWYYTIDGQTYGPVDAASLVDGVRRGAIARGTLVWMQGRVDWTPIERVPELNALVNS